MPLTAPLTKALIIHIIMARNKGEQLKKKLDILPSKFQLNFLYFVYKLAVLTHIFPVFPFEAP